MKNKNNIAHGDAIFSITPRTISIEDMKNYFAIDIPCDDKLYIAWCTGKLIFLLRGINLTDILLLKKSNIHNDRIIYKRSKTGKMYSIKILPQVTELIQQFSDNSDYLFGSLRNNKIQSSIYRSRIKIFNSYSL